MTHIAEQPYKPLHGEEACEMIKDIAEQTRTCMFATGFQSFPCDVRPMALQVVEEDGKMFFLSALDSEKNRDIERDPRVVLTFQNDSKLRYLVISGEARIHTDRATKEKYWSNLASAWFDGKEDPRLTVICVTPTSGHYWDTQDGKLISMAKMSWSALTGSKVDDGGVDGRLNL